VSGRLGSDFTCLLVANEPEHLSDEALVDLCRLRGSGDSRPFAELFRRHQHFVWRICYRFGGNAQDAEDLMQEVFFKTYRSLSQFRGASSFRTWLHQIAANTARNELRRRSRQPQMSDTPLEVLIEILPPGAPAAAHRSPARLAWAWQHLRPKERQVLHLKDVEQRPCEEIIPMLGLSLSAAKMRVLRARLAPKDAYRQLEN
jgi:RNA polymerase sigma-70 factor (ECF subfamily)